MPAPSSPSSPRTQRGDPGAIALGLGALLLFISLFLHWYQPGRSAWTVFEVWDLVLAVLAVIALVAALARLGFGPARSDRWLVGPSTASFVIVVAALLNHPPAAIGAGPMVGIWLALGGTVVMVAGAVTSLAQVSLVVEFAHRPPAARDRAPLGRPHLRRRRGGAGAGAGPAHGATASPAPGSPAPAATASPAPASPAPASAASSPSGGVEPPSVATEQAEPGPARRRAAAESLGIGVEPANLDPEPASPEPEPDTAVRPVPPADPDTQPTRVHDRPPEDPEAPRPDPAPE